MPERKNSSQSFSYKRRNRSKSFSRERKNSSHKYGSKKDDFSKSQIKMVISKKQSDIKNHLKFTNLKIKPRDQQEIIQLLKQRLTEYVGTVSHISKMQNPKPIKYEDSLSLVVGFKYDSNALNFLQGKYGELQITYHKEMIKFKPVPTEVFQLMIPKIKKAQLEREEKNNYRQTKRQDDKKGDTRRKRDSSQRSRNKKNKKKSQRSSSRSSSQESNRHLNLKSVLMFGVPLFTRDRKISQILQDMKQQSFIPQSSKWKKVQNSNCQYLEIYFQNKKAERILSLRDKIKIDGCPIILIQGTNSPHSIRKQLKEFQFLIKFPQKVHPFSVYRALSSCGKVVQLVADQSIDSGLCDSYWVSVSNSYLANDLRKIGKTSEGIIINEVNEGQLIYRPSQHSSLHNLQKKERNQKQGR